MSFVRKTEIRRVNIYVREISVRGGGVRVFALMRLGKLSYLTPPVPVCSQPAINYNSNLLDGWLECWETILSLSSPFPLSPETRDHFISIVLIRAITRDTSDILETNNQLNIKFTTLQSPSTLLIASHYYNCPAERLVSILPSV